MDISEFEKWTSNILPCRQIGFLLLTTTYGVLISTVL